MIFLFPQIIADLKPQINADKIYEISGTNQHKSAGKIFIFYFPQINADLKPQINAENNLRNQRIIISVNQRGKLLY